MHMKQISIFAENTKGTLAQITQLLVDNELDIRAIAVFDTTEFGILRMVVSDPDKALRILAEEGYVAKMSRIIAVEPPDEPGSLNRIFHILADHDINVEYIYSFVMRKQELPYIVFSVNKEDEAAAALRAEGIKIIE